VGGESGDGGSVSVDAGVGGEGGTQADDASSRIDAGSSEGGSGGSL
jgi:hypothetical protein